MSGFGAKAQGGMKMLSWRQDPTRALREEIARIEEQLSAARVAGDFSAIDRLTLRLGSKRFALANARRWTVMYNPRNRMWWPRMSRGGD